MRAVPIVGIAAVGTLAALTASSWHTFRTPSPADHWALVDRYCVTCHNDLEFAGEVAFDKLNRDNLAADAAVWEDTIRKLRGHLMPPPGEPRPADSKVEALASWLEGSLDAAARAEPNP